MAATCLQTGPIGHVESLQDKRCGLLLNMLEYTVYSSISPSAGSGVRISRSFLHSGHTRQFDALIGPPRSSMGLVQAGQVPLILLNLLLILKVRRAMKMPARGSAQNVTTMCGPGIIVHPVPSTMPPTMNAIALPMRAASG